MEHDLETLRHLHSHLVKPEFSKKLRKETEVLSTLFRLSSEIEGLKAQIPKLELADQAWSLAHWGKIVQQKPRTEKAIEKTVQKLKKSETAFEKKYATFQKKLVSYQNQIKKHVIA
jgi:predicted  nucleic acid-binding Zn-ribbon protein